MARSQNPFSYESGPKAWGYFVDTPSRWILLYILWRRRMSFSAHGCEEQSTTYPYLQCPIMKNAILPLVEAPAREKTRTSSALYLAARKMDSYMICRRKEKRFFGNANERGIWNGLYERKLLSSIPQMGRCMMRPAIVPTLYALILGFWHIWLMNIIWIWAILEICMKLRLLENIKIDCAQFC